MNLRSLPLLNLFAVTFLAYPSFIFAAMPDDAHYFTDAVNSYVQDQVSKDMEELNKFLCFVSATAPNLLVNEPDYIAMISTKVCSPDTSGNNNGMMGNNNNAGSPFITVQVNSSRKSNTDPMLTQIWLDDFADTTTGNNGGMAMPGMPVVAPLKYSVPLYISASQAPAKTLPFGIFRLDFCKMLPTDKTCDKQIGYIDSTKKGLAFYTLKMTGPYSEYFEEFALQLSANSSTDTGNGIVIKTNNLITVTNPKGDILTSATVFAHSPDYFFRDAGQNPQCFRRAGKFAEESVWRYGLYDTDKGERLIPKTGFPIEYVYTSNNLSNTGTVGKTYNGNINYWGMYMPVDVPSGETLSQIDYSVYPPNKINYTLLRAAGKLTRHTTNFMKLSDISNAPFYVYFTVPILDTTGGTAMVANQSYYIYWDNAASQFYVFSTYNTTTWQYEKLATPIPISNASIGAAAAAATWDFYSNTSTLPSGFRIKLAEFQALGTTLGNTRLITDAYDTVYPAEYQALNDAGGLQCINNCPTAASLAANTYTYDWNTAPYTTFATLVNYTYSLNPLTGNLQDGTPAGAAPSQPSGSTVKQDNLNVYSYTGKLVSKTDMDKIAALKGPCVVALINVCSEADIDLLANVPGSTGYSYYTWETSTNYWNQASFLLDAQQNAVKLYPPVNVTFDVPNSTKYDRWAGTTVGLWYNSFGELWGIEYKCIDISTNVDCIQDPILPTFTAWANRRYIPAYSIPYGADGVVTVSASQGDIVKGTKYLVKGLEKEVRLAKVPNGLCTVLGLDQPISVTKLPSATEWNDPTKLLGTRLVLDPPPAPRVIHGVKQY